jgi:hypothetical protein
MEKDWVLIYTTSRPQLAELIKGILNEAEINSIPINKQDSSYLFGEVEIYVRQANALKAKHLISKTNT